MKKGLDEIMDELLIDKNIRSLISKMWDHGYETVYSCQGGGDGNMPGHATKAYMLYKEGTGDGWFEENAENYGLKFYEKNNCCKQREKMNGVKICFICNAGVNGHKYYKGPLKNPE